MLCYIAYYPDICVLYIREDQDDAAEELLVYYIVTTKMM